jgi:hypothetical protein
VLNDWLKAEFKKRIGARRKILLTNKLTVALKRLDEIVTQADEEAERQVLSKPINEYLDVLYAPSVTIDPESLRGLLSRLALSQLQIPAVPPKPVENDD